MKEVRGRGARLRVQTSPLAGQPTLTVVIVIILVTMMTIILVMIRYAGVLRLLLLLFHVGALLPRTQILLQNDLVA